MFADESRIGSENDLSLEMRTGFAPLTLGFDIAIHMVTRREIPQSQIG